MKKINWLLTLCFGLLMIGCAQKQAENDVIIVPESPVIIEKTNTIVVEKNEPTSSTTIELDKNGVKVKATDVEVDIKSK